jgi:hypothetical protein
MLHAPFPSTNTPPPYHHRRSSLRPGVSGPWARYPGSPRQSTRPSGTAAPPPSRRLPSDCRTSSELPWQSCSWRSGLTLRPAPWSACRVRLRAGGFGCGASASLSRTRSSVRTFRMSAGSVCSRSVISVFSGSLGNWAST